MGTLGKAREAPRKPTHGCRAVPKARLEAKPASSPLPCHPGLAQITQFRMMVPLGHFAKGASLDDLIDSCVQSFDADGNLCRSNQLLQVMLTMHRILISSAELLQKVITLYKDALAKNSPGLCLKICYFVRYWITEFWIMFKMDTSLASTMEEFQELVKANGEELHCRLIDTTQINARDWSRKLTQRIKSNTSKKRKVSLLFDHLEPEELSEHLTFLEFKSFRRISVCIQGAGEKLPCDSSESKQRNSTGRPPPPPEDPSGLVGFPVRLCVGGQVRAHCWAVFLLLRSPLHPPSPAPPPHPSFRW